MPKVAIRKLFCTDVELDVWQPVSDTDVRFWVSMEIGMVGNGGADIFQVMVATPDGLKRGSEHEEVIVDRGVIILHRFSWPILRRALDAVVKKCECNDWIEASTRLQRFFFWEYEDYVMEAR